ncbi:carbamate kinase [Staphylococcus aureus]|nr:carbamate kinase [Staphylococcus aureus]
MKEKIVIALGGNAIQTTEATAEAQQTAIRCAMQNLKPLFDSPARIVISHGNGPQIGSLLIQQAKSNSDTTPAMPLDTCGAMSQGMIGYWLETEINRILTEMNSDRTVGTIVTRVEVKMIHDLITQLNQLVLFIRKKKLKNYKKNSQTQSLKKMQDVVIEK